MAAVRLFGHLYEGMQVDSETAPEVLDSLRCRYKRRLLLSDLTNMPEGYEFRFELQGQPTGVILLSPPEVVAVLRRNGTWLRVPRDIAHHGPPPYSRAWYHAYLARHNLPYYFLQVGHRNLRDNLAEAENLGLREEDLPPSQTLPSSTYLITRYPAAQMVPDPNNEMMVRSYVLSEEEQRAIARRFPATNLLKGEKRVLIHPGGYITLPHNDAADVDASALGPPVRWIFNKGIGSYIVDPSYVQVDLSAQGLRAINIEQRRLLLRDFRADGAFVVNPRGIPNGLGDWSWLHQDDPQLAQSLNYTYPKDVAMARACDMLTSGAEEAALPATLWLPVPDYLNPPEQPAIPGKWDFLTEEDRSLGQRVLATLLAIKNQDLQAHHVWNIRQEYKQGIERGEIDIDLTTSINLVWVPRQAAPGNATHSSTSSSLSPEPRNPLTSTNAASSSSNTRKPDQNFGIDERTKLAHEPFNRGENDQTARALPSFYQTRMFPKGKITVDRARARIDCEEEHKLWICDSTGEFRRYAGAGAGKADWADKAFIERLNKWRNQTFQRNEWPTKREPTRPGYTKTQRDWVYQRIVDAHGAYPRTPISILTKEFNDTFPGDTRTHNGLQGLIDRLRREYRESHSASGGQKGASRQQSESESSEEQASPSPAFSRPEGEGSTEAMKDKVMKMATRPNPAFKRYSDMISGSGASSYSHMNAANRSGTAPGGSVSSGWDLSAGGTRNKGKGRELADSDYVPSDQEEDADGESDDQYQTD